MAPSPGNRKFSPELKCYGAILDMWFVVSETSSSVRVYIKVYVFTNTHALRFLYDNALYVLMQGEKGPLSEC
jgi:hypothetical protein